MKAVTEELEGKITKKWKKKKSAKVHIAKQGSMCTVVALMYVHYHVSADKLYQEGSPVGKREGLKHF